MGDIMQKLTESINTGVGTLSSNPVRALGLLRGFNKSDVKKAYRKYALKYHPDKNPDCDSSAVFTVIQGAYEKLIASTLPDLPAINPHPSSFAEHRHPVYPAEIPKYVFEKKYVYITKEDRKKSSHNTPSNPNNFASVSSKKNADEKFFELSTDMLRSLLKEFGYRKPPGYPDIQLDDMSRSELLKVYLSVTADFNRLKKRSKSTGSDIDIGGTNKSSGYNRNDDDKNYGNSNNNNYKDDNKNKHNKTNNTATSSNNTDDSLRYHSSFHKYKNKNSKHSTSFDDNEDHGNTNNANTGNTCRNDIYNVKNNHEKQDDNTSDYEVDNEDGDYRDDFIKKRKEETNDKMRDKKMEDLGHTSDNWEEIVKGFEGKFDQIGNSKRGPRTRFSIDKDENIIFEDYLKYLNNKGKNLDVGNIHQHEDIDDDKSKQNAANKMKKIERLIGGKKLKKNNIAEEEDADAGISAQTDSSTEHTGPNIELNQSNETLHPVANVEPEGGGGGGSNVHPIKTKAFSATNLMTTEKLKAMEAKLL
eukprot:CAMPEP_0119046372 /NCGR_PEP_ID=MMETSP1177-20130426/46187_1 /TAXON_ID=2985 /ORGANISM="Ochromonas sp, Strain CCMP1899" /LENGTH=529 /DNA_ID=CAMNT_0007019439 /DNA_START=547 /DNA_END=2134 /DNA_ORIENTATION=+